MNRILLSFCCFILYTTTNHAQYTTIINANRPGDTETPYSVGTGVIQIENSLLYHNFTNPNDFSETNAFSNNVSIQYGFLLERLQASLNHKFTHGKINNNPNDVTGTENLSIGLKYLIYEHVNKESPELKKSWKRRYGFKHNGLIPSVAIAAKYHTPFSNSQFLNGGTNSYSLSIITQNNINKRLIINNQFDYNNHGGNYDEMVYSVSSSYVVAKRWNPYFQFQFHGLETRNYISLGIGTPFLISKDFAVSAQYNTSFVNNVSGHEIGLNLAYRIDNHKDKWIKIRSKKDDEEEEDLSKKVKSTEKAYSNYSKEELSQLSRSEKKKLKRREKEILKENKAIDEYQSQKREEDFFKAMLDEKMGEQTELTLRDYSEEELADLSEEELTELQRLEKERIKLEKPIIKQAKKDFAEQEKTRRKGEKNNFLSRASESTEKLYSEYTKEEQKALSKNEKKRLKKLEKEVNKNNKALRKQAEKELKKQESLTIVDIPELEASTEKMYSEYSKEELEELPKDEKKRLKKLEKERKKQIKERAKLAKKNLKEEENLRKQEAKEAKENEELSVEANLNEELRMLESLSDEDNSSDETDLSEKKELSKKELKAEKKRLKKEAKEKKKQAKKAAKAEKKRLKQEAKDKENEVEDVITTY